MTTKGAEIARRTRREQGLPEHVDDPTTLDAIAELLRLGKEQRARDKQRRRRKAS